MRVLTTFLCLAGLLAAVGCASSNRWSLDQDLIGAYAAVLEPIVSDPFPREAVLLLKVENGWEREVVATIPRTLITRTIGFGDNVETRDGRLCEKGSGRFADTMFLQVVERSSDEITIRLTWRESWPVEGVASYVVRKKAGKWVFAEMRVDSIT